MRVPDWLGKSEGLVAFGLAAFAVATALRIAGLLTGQEWVSACGLILGSVFGGSAAAAYRK